MLLHKLLNSLDHVHCRCRIIEICRSHGNHGSSCHNKLQCILCGTDASHTKHRKLYGVSNLIYHPDCHRLYCRTGHATGLVCQCKLTAVNINLHTRQCIDQRQGISSTCLCRFRCLCDICHIWTELHDHRLLCFLFDLCGDLLHQLRILSEGNAALLDIRTGNIDLQQIHILIRQTLYHLQIFFCGMTTHIDNDPCIILLQIWNISLHEYIYAGILQTNGI